MRPLSVLSKLSLIALLGCSTERSPSPSPSAATPPVPVETAAAVTPAPQSPPPNRALSAVPEAVDGRDPFQSAVPVPGAVTPPRAADDRPRKSKRFTIDELKLVGIVSTSDSPRAMLVDPRGKGWVVTRGELLGRAEVIHDGEGDHPVSWRVDRIRESEVVLVREDAARSTVPSSTRVLALHHAPVVADDAELDD